MRFETMLYLHAWGPERRLGHRTVKSSCNVRWRWIMVPSTRQTSSVVFGRMAKIDGSPQYTERELNPCRLLYLLMENCMITSLPSVCTEVRPPFDRHGAVFVHASSRSREEMICYCYLWVVQSIHWIEHKVDDTQSPPLDMSPPSSARALSQWADSGPQFRLLLPCSASVASRAFWITTTFTLTCHPWYTGWYVALRNLFVTLS